MKFMNYAKKWLKKKLAPSDWRNDAYYFGTTQTYNWGSSDRYRIVKQMQSAGSIGGNYIVNLPTGMEINGTWTEQKRIEESKR